MNDAGNMVYQIWEQFPKRFPTITLDAFVVMPNHIHGIIWIVEAQFIAPHSLTRLDNTSHIDQGVINHAPTLGKIIRTFKALSTRLIRKNDSTEFAWQRNYHERVIRNDNELDWIREYIVSNPLQWALDRENPEGSGLDPLDEWLNHCTLQTLP